jgi:hypothetical protein
MKLIKIKVLEKKENNNEVKSLIITIMNLKDKNNILDYANLIRREIIKETVRIKEIKQL